MSPASAAVTEVGPIEASEGELRFSVSIDGRDHDVFMRASLPVLATADVAVPLTLVPAMAIGGTLRIEGSVDELLLRRLPEIQSVFRAWHRRGEWSPAAPFRHDLEVSCAASVPRTWAGQDRRVAAFFSGGVDSFATVLANPEITDLIYLSGYDVPLAEASRDARVRAALADGARRLGKSLSTIETNAREIGDGLVPWLAYCGSVLGGAVRMLAPAMRRVYISASIAHRSSHPNGSHPLLDHLWGGEGLEVVHAGAERTRAEKLRLLTESDVARRTLRVCWESPDSEYNCGRCEKCLRTMVVLEALGVRDRFHTFPQSLDLDAVAAIVPNTAPVVDYWTEGLELAVGRGDRSLIAAIESCLANVAPQVRSPPVRVPPTPAPRVDLARRAGSEITLGARTPRATHAGDALTSANGTTIRSVSTLPGELRFTIDFAGRPLELWIRASVPVVPGADAAVALTLTAAMTRAGPLRVQAPVSEALLGRLPEIQAILRSWQKRGDWPAIDPVRHEVEVICPTTASPPPEGDRRVAAFFSGGVDSFATLLRHPEISDLIYMEGFDVPIGSDYEAHHARMRDAVARTAERFGKSVVHVDINARELYDPILPGPAYGGSFRAAVARFLATRFGRIYNAAGLHYDHLFPNSGHPLLDHLWGAGALDFVHDGTELRRTDKLALIADEEAAQAVLRVCWKDPHSEQNCGRCEKCLRTMVALEALGALERFETFPELSLDAVAAARPALAPEIAYWQENLELATDRQASPDLIAAIEACLAAVAPPDSPAAGAFDRVAGDEYRRVVIAHDQAQAKIEELSEMAAWQGARLRDIEGSASWRWTAPLRWVKGLRRRRG